MIRVSKIILLTLIFINVILVSFASFFMILSLNINSKIESIKFEKNYTRQITFQNTFPKDLSPNRTVKVLGNVELQLDLYGVVDVGYVDNREFLLESDINSGFEIVGNNFKNNNEAIVNKEFLLKHGKDLIGQEITYKYNEEIYTVNIVGTFDEAYSNHLNNMGYPKILVYSDSNFQFVDTIYTIEMEDIVDLKKFNDNNKNSINNYKISNDIIELLEIVSFLNIAKYISFFLVVIFVFFCIIGSKLFVIATIDENKKTIFLLITLGIKNKTLSLFIFVFSLFFALVVTSISSIVNTLFIKLILKPEMLTIKFYSINYLSYLVILLFYFIVIYVYIYYTFLAEMKSLRKGEKNV